MKINLEVELDVEAGRNEYTECDLDKMSEILVKADEIKEDGVAYELVKRHMSEKAGKYTSISDLRDKVANGEIEEKGTGKD